MERTIRRMALIASCGAMLSALTLTPAQAATTSGVTTGGATNITGSSATVHGDISSSSGASAYSFVYGKTSSYGQLTTIEPAPKGSASMQEVTATITGLSPGTTYHFELVAVVGSGTYSSQVPGGDMTFTTGSSSSNGTGSNNRGSLGLVTSRLPVKHGKIAISLRCGGSHSCAGGLSIMARHKVGNKLKMVSCVKNARFTIGAGKGKTLKPAVGGRCVALLSKASKHKLGGKLTASPSTGQAKLSKQVRLISK